jgi:hypothetical protein
VRKVVFESPRPFQQWRWNVGHSELLLRSNKDASNSTRIEILFKPVDALKIRALMNGLRIVEVDDSEAEAIRLDAALDEKSMPAISRQSRIYAVESGVFRGYIVAAVIFVHEDDLEYYAPTPFSRQTIQPAE